MPLATRERQHSARRSEVACPRALSTVTSGVTECVTEPLTVAGVIRLVQKGGDRTAPRDQRRLMSLRAARGRAPVRVTSAAMS